MTLARFLLGLLGCLLFTSFANATDHFAAPNGTRTGDGSIDHPVQIRIYNERAAFDGRLALGYVTMTPHANVSSNTRDYLTTVLSE
jgi:hypothetical protein